MNRYYTYAYLREDGTPYYIGKGCGNRAYLQLNHKVKTPDKSKILILKNNLTEESANKHERYIINLLGRKDLGTGILRNLTDGGEGVSGMKHNKESKNKMRKPKSKEHKKKLRDSIKEKWNRGEYDREEWKRRNLGKKQSEDTIRKKIDGLKKYYQQNKKVLTEEQKKQISETLKQKYKNGEIKILPQSPNLSAKWWNNGKINKRSLECPGNDWKSGRINSKTTKGYKWWNNDQINTRSVECPGVGWKTGKLNKIASN
jgi:hypothetical protein